MVEIWGRYEPKSGSEWMMSLKGKPCKILRIYGDYTLVRIFDDSWGIRGGFVMSCPACHIEIVGDLE